MDYYYVMDYEENINVYVWEWQGYGMTEASGLISVENPKEGGERLSGSTGTLIPSVESRIVSLDTSKHLLPPNQLGEICLRGPTIMQGSG